MRLSDFKGDEALELLADIIEPASTIINDPKTKELRADKLKVAQHILKNHKKEAFNIYELLYKKDAKEATPIDIVGMVIDILSDKQLLDLFTQQSQNTESTSSGSAMGNTEDGEK